MDYSIKADGGLFDIHILDADKATATLVHQKLTDVLMGTATAEAKQTFWPEERQYVDLSTFSAVKLLALKEAAQNYYLKASNIILVIKHIRTLTDGNLLQSKQLVDYAMDGHSAPAWWKWEGK
jgi:hypothetical protein